MPTVDFPVELMVDDSHPSFDDIRTFNGMVELEDGVVSDDFANVRQGTLQHLGVYNGRPVKVSVKLLHINRRIEVGPRIRAVSRSQQDVLS